MEEINYIPFLENLISNADNIVTALIFLAGGLFGTISSTTFIKGLIDHD